MKFLSKQLTLSETSKHGYRCIAECLAAVSAQKSHKQNGLCWRNTDQLSQLHSRSCILIASSYDRPVPMGVIQNPSWVLVISGIQTHWGELRSARRPWSILFLRHCFFSVITLQNLQKSLPNCRKSRSDTANHRCVWKKSQYCLKIWSNSIKKSPSRFGYSFPFNSHIVLQTPDDFFYSWTVSFNITQKETYTINFHHLPPLMMDIYNFVDSSRLNGAFMHQ